MIRQTLSLFYLLLFYTQGFSQDAEEIYLHIDKDIYLPGETIWFKAYVFANNVPSAGSTNFYAGLYSPGGKLIYKKQLPLFEGTCNGEFVIPDSIKYQYLQLGVFTKNSLAASSPIPQIKPIVIFQKNDSANLQAQGADEKIQLQFFPEGGTMVAGLPNYIGVKAWYSDSHPAAINAAVIETATGNLIDSVFTMADGLGKFQFSPHSGKKYEINWLDNMGNKNTMALPDAIENGVVLHSEMAAGKLYYSIQKKNSLPRFEKLHLSVTQGKEILYKESLLLKDKNHFVNNFITDSFPAGLLHLILTDDEQNVLQQKSIFIAQKRTTPQIKILEKNMIPKGKNVIEIWVPDSLLNNLSVSIADIGFYKTTSTSSIYDETVLNNNNSITGSLLGDAIQMNDEKKTDLVLLTHDIKSTPTVSNTIADDYLSLSVLHKNKNSLPAKSTLTMIINDPGTGKQFFMLPPTSSSGFSKSGLIFYDSAKVYFKVGNDKELSEKLTLNKESELRIPEQISAIRPAQFHGYISAMTDNETLETYITKKPAKFNEVQTINTVVIKSKYINPITKRTLELDKKYTSGMFSGIARGHQLNALDDPAAERSIDVFGYIVFRIPGLKTAGSFGSRKIINAFRGGVPILFINEIESPDDMLETLSVTQLAYVKFIPGIVIGSSGVYTDGALYIYTKRGDEPGATTTPNMITVMVKGYDASKDFLTPDYSNKTASVNPDYRSTLYWNPYIVTDKSKNKITIEYYNNDISKKHLLILKGFNSEGRLVEVKSIIQ